MNIGFLTTIWNSGPSYYRLELPSKTLVDTIYHYDFLNDYEPEISGHLLAKTWNLDGIHETVIDDIDIFVTQRWMNDKAADVTRKAQANGQKFVADIDDHYWSLPTDNPAFWATNPDMFPLYNREAYWDQIKASDAIICSTPTLQKLFEKLDVPVFLRRNMIDLDLWKFRDVTKTKWKPRVGWVGVTKWRQDDLTNTQNAIGNFINKHDLKFMQIGFRLDSPSAASLLGVEEKNSLPPMIQMEFNEYPPALKQAKFDIGIVPMQGSEFNAAKTCLKGMEYAASGIPFVANALPEYENLGIGILVKTPKDWERALEKLRDPLFRQEKSVEGYERIKQEDYRVRSLEYAEIFDKI